MSCFTSLAKPTFLDSRLVFSYPARNVCVFPFDFWLADANTIGYIGGLVIRTLSVHIIQTDIPAEHRPRGHVASACGVVHFRRFIVLGLAASVNWGCAVLITAVTVASIDSGQSYVATRADCHVSYRLIIHPQTSTSGIFIALLLSHSLVCCLATTTFIARVKNYITINIWCALRRIDFLSRWSLTFIEASVWW